MPKLERRFYIDKGLYFEVYEDGTVIMFVFGKEVDSKKMRPGVSNSAIREAFGSELTMYGVGIDPKMKMAQIEKRLTQLTKQVQQIIKEKK